MKKMLLSTVVMAMLFGFISCANTGNDGAGNDSGIYVLMNIPYEKFYAGDNAGAISDFDAVTSATTKACNGSLAYGSYHSTNNTDTNKEKTLGITFPVYVSSKSLLKDFTEVKDDTGDFSYTIAGRGSSSTTKYSGRQNLFKSPDYSYYVLSAAPKFYKELSVTNGNYSFGALKGGAAENVVSYVQVSSATHHLPNGYEIALYLDEAKSKNIASMFTGEKAVSVAADGTETEATLNAVKAAVLETSDGTKYGLPMIDGLWRGFEVGFDLNKINIVGKTITKITLISEEKQIVISKAKLYNSETSAWGDEADLSIPVKAINAK